MKAPVLASIVISITATAAHAGFIMDKKAWDEMSPGQKSGYAMGAFDEYETLYAGAESNHQIQKDYAQCLLDLGLRASDLVAIIESGFSDLENWSSTANLILLRGLSKVCRGHIEEYRRGRGELDKE